MFHVKHKLHRWSIGKTGRKANIMKKALQIETNKLVIDKFTELKASMRNLTHIKQLRNCQAHVYALTDNERYLVLESYNTIIAILDRKTGCLYDGLRYVYGYTATSAQHIAKFYTDYDGMMIYRYYTI